MKIYFDGVNWEAEHTGPNCFARRLAIELGNLGHQLADADDYDVSLVFIEPTANLNQNLPYVLRVDGMWFSPEQHARGMNAKMADAHKNADLVIYQSEFDRRMLTKWFGQPRTNSVIRNGISLCDTEIRSEALIELRQKYDKIFVCSANWHNQKRLIDNIEYFKFLKNTQYPNSCLVVMGSNPAPLLPDKSIYYTNSLRHDLCAEVYAVADWMIHLAWLDHCPNSVVEAISKGCPVICASEGGTRELVEPSNGVVLDDASEYKFELTDYDAPPRVPSKNYRNLPEGYRAVRSTVDIKHTAKSYESALLSVVKH